MEDARNPPLLKGNERGENKKLISWNIKGDPGNDIRVHKDPFYVTENRGLIEIVNNDIDFNYILYYLREHFIKLGKFSRSNEAHAGKARKLKIRIPVDDNGNINLEKQREIAEKYRQILELRKTIYEKLHNFRKITDNVDVFL